jgi:hypothetical protein
MPLPANPAFNRFTQRRQLIYFFVADSYHSVLHTPVIAPRYLKKSVNRWMLGHFSPQFNKHINVFLDSQDVDIVPSDFAVQKPQGRIPS